MVLKKLLCLCNDNSDCILNPLPEAVYENFTGRPHQLGHCVTSSEGVCYTVKDVALPPSSNMKHRRRQAGYSIKPSLTDVTESNSVGNIQTESIQQGRGTVELNVYFDIRYGCLSSHSQVTLSCNAHLVNHLVPKTIACCNSSDFCNAHLSPNFVYHPTPKDAYHAAVRNWRMLGQVAHPNKQSVLTSGLNAGPNLLSGGKPIYNFPSQTYRAPSVVPEYKQSTLFNVLFGTAFGVIAMTLVILFIGVYCCYKQRLRKGKIRALETHLWYPSPFSHRFNNRRIPSSSVINSWNSQTKPAMARNIILCIRQRRQVSRDCRFDSASHTVSSNLTRTVGNSSDALITDIKFDASRCGQRTISKQVSLKRFLGRGRFSDVWMGLWRGEPVTVKIFVANSRLGQIIWRRTIMAHRSMLLRHRNIQGIMAADWIHYPLDVHKQLLSYSGAECSIGPPAIHAMFVSELFPLGTLSDLMSQYVWLISGTHDSENPECSSAHKVYTLSREGVIDQKPLLTVTDEQMINLILRLALNLVQGLCFIHSDYVGTRGKPALAHRDLKPSNVFLRADWTCCIGDIGFSVRAPPNPLPSSLSELNRLYSQHNAHLQSSLIRSVLPVHSPQSVECYTPKEELRSETCTDRIERVTSTDDFTTAEMKEGIQLRSSSKLTIDKMEFLDWWPVGGLQCGTARYIAPELLNNSVNPFRLESHQRADIYSLGLIFWELITWALPQHLRPRPRQLSESSHPESHSERSSPDPVLEEDTNSCTLVGLRSMRIHRPAYQREWEQLCTRNERYSGVVPLLPTNPPNKSYSTLSNAHSVRTSCGLYTSEPNVEAMRQLVCDLQLRPRLPTTLDHLEAGMLYKTAVAAGDQFQLYNRMVDVKCGPTVQVMDLVGGVKRGSGESSSSGASSLKDAATASSMATVMQEENISRIELSPLLCMVISQFSTLLPECWSPDPDSRLTALRVRKTLERISGLLDEVNRAHISDPNEEMQHSIPVDGDCVSESVTIKETSCVQENIQD